MTARWEDIGIYDGGSMKGRQQGHGPRPVRAVLAGSRHESLSHFLRQDGCMALSSKTGEEGTYKQRPDGWILNRNKQRVPFCNALFIHKRQVCVNRRDFRLSCKSSSILGGDDRLGVGLEDSRKFQFLNTRKQE